MKTCNLTYKLKIELDCPNPLFLEKSIDEFMANIPEYLNSLTNSNEKIKVVLDKRKKE